MVIVGLNALLDLLFIDVGYRCQLGHRGLTHILLFELTDLVINLRERSHLVEWQTNNATLLGNSLQNALPNPPNGIRNELESACLIKFLSSFHQSDVAFIDEICK